jgi:hypothetical protein
MHQRQFFVHMFGQKLPKNTAQFLWTNHVARKMRQYGLSEGRIRRVLSSPKRREEGIAPKTVAVMQAGGSSKHPHEIWVMYQEIKDKGQEGEKKGKKTYNAIKHFLPIRKRIITAWRYPGVSKKRDQIPIPAEILEELDELT